MADSKTAPSLASLRRLYHHVVNGGSTTADDERRTGLSPITAKALAATIREAERRETPYDAGAR
jgi:hypothetical protein